MIAIYFKDGRYCNTAANASLSKAQQPSDGHAKIPVLMTPWTQKDISNTCFSSWYHSNIFHLESSPHLLVLNFWLWKRTWIDQVFGLGILEISSCHGQWDVSQAMYGRGRISCWSEEPVWAGVRGKEVDIDFLPPPVFSSCSLHCPQSLTAHSLCLSSSHIYCLQKDNGNQSEKQP